MSWIHTFFLGEDPEKDQQSAAIADQKLRELNQTKRAQFGEAWFQQTEANIARGEIGDAKAQVNQAFYDGVGESLDAMGEGIQKTASAVIPWQVYALGAVLFFMYAGRSKR